MATGLSGYLETEKKQAFSIGALSLAMLMAVCAAALVVYQTTGFSDLKPYGPAESWKWVVAALGLLTWGVLLALSAIASQPRKKLTLFCLFC